MPKEAVFTLKLEADLRDQFMAEAAATDRPASQLVREFMREFVERQQNAREHDAWFRAEVTRSLDEAKDPTVERISHEEIRRQWRSQRAAFEKRTRRKTK
ncbi:CopG family ribbon-helix-helix protein [Reyranella sp. CPCC 100927]|uniref:CopG family ribbon-helix-helix protein n=1 Tax=Reyranella sp. CPCC 100927 TaxID=2599616 RepID=UPI0011B7EEEE|nr:antitoxin of toxin-antitoxin stability system [Reyranella sp. CPCC 100927]TWT00660.1 antitoxin of toxin-antitoxin stability system [Reyranella sp. CPCC 100927]